MTNNEFDWDKNRLPDFMGNAVTVKHRIDMSQLALINCNANTECQISSTLSGLLGTGITTGKAGILGWTNPI